MKRILFPLLLCSFLEGATFSVTNNNDDGNGSLREAIEDANDNGDSRNTIEITGGLSPITLESPLPFIEKDLTIQTTSGTQIINGNDLYRGLFISQGNVEIHDVAFENVKEGPTSTLSTSPPQ